MKSIIRRASALSALALAVGACGYSEGDFVAAIEEIEAQPVCDRGPMRIGALLLETGNYLVSNSNTIPHLIVLERAGLVGAEERLRVGGGILVRNETARKLTDLGSDVIALQRSFMAGEGSLQHVCWGTREPVKVTEFTEPSELGGMTMTDVRFEHRIDAHEWTTPELLAALGVDPDKVEVGSAGLVKTNKGWRADRVNWSIR